jgi:hypothetical protein
MYRNLQDSENMAASGSTPRNRLQPSDLAGLFDERKTVASQLELDRLAERYNMDGDVVERLARYVNTPSVTEAGTQTARSAEGDEQGKKMLVKDICSFSGNLLIVV